MQASFLVGPSPASLSNISSTRHPAPTGRFCRDQRQPGGVGAAQGSSFAVVKISLEIEREGRGRKLRERALGNGISPGSTPALDSRGACNHFHFGPNNRLALTSHQQGRSVLSLLPCTVAAPREGELWSPLGVTSSLRGWPGSDGG